ncbi:MAG: hypothetical protein JW959_07805, partial [Pirellulales bacterium]|nr:hypothetical protein [Pirellulales bacterium]
SAPLGREYALASGLMEITYKSGARVILEGPCAYKVDSSAGGFLAIGKLTANIRTQSSMPKAQSSDFSPLPPLSSPLFSVRTPTAIITDLGTEFGVEVSKEGNTTSHVFSGSVKVAVLADSGNEEAGREVILGENESALVRHGKDAEDRLIVMRDPAPGKGDRFVRSLQSKSAETVRIVEKFASGKLGAAFEQMPPGRYVIVPGAAEHPRQEPLAPQGRQTRGYIRTVAADFCDRDFVFEATFQVHFDGPAHVPGTPSPHHVFFGLGDGVPNADYYDVVTCGLVLEFTADTGELLVRFRHPESKLHRPGDLGRTVTEMAPPGSPRPGRHRFRMSVTGKSVTFAVDADFDGEFQPDFVSRPIHLLAAGPSLLDATNSRLLVGTGNCDAMTVRFEELSITYVETKPQKKHNEDNQ